jgi:hypothetical protein
MKDWKRKCRNRTHTYLMKYLVVEPETSIINYWFWNAFKTTTLSVLFYGS